MGAGGWGGGSFVNAVPAAGDPPPPIPFPLGTAAVPTTAVFVPLYAGAPPPLAMERGLEGGASRALTRRQALPRRLAEPFTWPPWWYHDCGGAYLFCQAPGRAESHSVGLSSNRATRAVPAQFPSRTASIGCLSSGNRRTRDGPRQQASAHGLAVSPHHSMEVFCKRGASGTCATETLTGRGPQHMGHNRGARYGDESDEHGVCDSLCGQFVSYAGR